VLVFGGEEGVAAGGGNQKEVEGGGDQRKVTTPKTSEALVFEVGWSWWLVGIQRWWRPERRGNPENERLGSFWGWVVVVVVAKKKKGWWSWLVGSSLENNLRVKKKHTSGDGAVMPIPPSLELPACRRLLCALHWWW